MSVTPVLDLTRLAAPSRHLRNLDVPTRRVSPNIVLNAHCDELCGHSRKSAHLGF